MTDSYKDLGDLEPVEDFMDDLFRDLPPDEYDYRLAPDLFEGDEDGSWNNAYLIEVDWGAEAGETRYEIGAIDLYDGLDDGDGGGSYQPLTAFDDPAPASDYYQDLLAKGHRRELPPRTVATFTEQAATDRQFMRGAIQVAQGVTWFGVGILGGSVLEYLTQGYIAVRLGPDGFGIFDLGLRVTLIVTIFAAMAMPNTVTYFIPHLKAQNGKEQIDQLVSFSILLTLFVSLVIGMGLFLAADLISSNLLNEPDLIGVLRIFALTVPSATLVLVVLGNLRGLKRSREASLLTSTYERTLRLGFVVLFFALGMGVNAAPWAYLPASLFVVLLGLYYLRRTGIQFVLARSAGLESRQIITYTWPLLSSQVLGQLIPSVQPLVLARFHDAHIVGLYATAWLIAPRLFGLINSAFGFLYVPVISELKGADDTQSMQRLYRLVTRWQLIMILPTYILIVTFPDRFLSLVGSQFVEARWVLVLLATSFLIGLSFGQVGATLLATGNTKIYLLLNVAGMGIGLVTGLLLIPTWDLVGAGFAHLTTMAVWNMLTWLVVYRKYSMNPFDRGLLVVLATVVACWLLAYPVVYFADQVTPLAVVAAVPILSIIYVLVLVYFHLLDEDSQKFVEQFTRLLLEKLGTAILYIRQKIKGN